MSQPVKKPKAIYIGESETKSAVESLRAGQWEFHPSAPDVNAFYSGMADGTISTDIQVIFIEDTFFDPTGDHEDLQVLVSTMAPHCFLCVVSTQPQRKAAIKESVRENALALGMEREMHYQFMGAKNPGKDLRNALREYVKNTKNEEVADTLLGSTPETL